MKFVQIVLVTIQATLLKKWFLFVFPVTPNFTLYLASLMN